MDNKCICICVQLFPTELRLLYVSLHRYLIVGSPNKFNVPSWEARIKAGPQTKIIKGINIQVPIFMDNLLMRYIDVHISMCKVLHIHKKLGWGLTLDHK